MDIPREDYEMELKGFRIKGIRKIVEEIEPLYKDLAEQDFFTFDDISQFLQMCAKNRVWGDATIKRNEVLVKELCGWVSIKAISVSDEDFSQSVEVEGTWDGIDWRNKEIYYTDAFQRLEKANWKRFVQPEYHDFVDDMDLTTLKQMMKDPLGNTFCPL